MMPEIDAVFKKKRVRLIRNGYNFPMELFFQISYMLVNRIGGGKNPSIRGFFLSSDYHKSYIGMEFPPPCASHDDFTGTH